MVNLFVGLFLVSCLALVIGLIRPSLIRLVSRKLALFIFGATTIVSFVLIAVVAPPVSHVPVLNDSSVSAAVDGTTTSTTDMQAIQNASGSIPSVITNTTATDVSTSNSVSTGQQSSPAQQTVSPTEPAKSTYGVQAKTSGCRVSQGLPDSTCTPGAILTTNSSVVCVSGYTQTVRDVTDSERQQVFAEYGIDYSLHGNYEVDHLISLELGGSNDISNLWPEQYYVMDGARTKDKLENYLHTQVCNGAMTLQEAQYEISSDWLKYFEQDGLTPAPSETSTGTQTQTNTSVSAQTTGGYYTSSYSTAKYYYPASCSAWKGLSPSYLKHFDTLDQLLTSYTRTLSPECQ